MTTTHGCLVLRVQQLRCQSGKFSNTSSLGTKVRNTLTQQRRRAASGIHHAIHQAAASGTHLRIVLINWPVPLNPASLVRSGDLSSSSPSMSQSSCSGRAFDVYSRTTRVARSRSLRYLQANLPRQYSAKTASRAPEFRRFLEAQVTITISCTKRARSRMHCKKVD